MSFGLDGAAIFFALQLLQDVVQALGSSHNSAQQYEKFFKQIQSTKKTLQFFIKPNQPRDLGPELEEFLEEDDRERREYIYRFELKECPEELNLEQCLEELELEEELEHIFRLLRVLRCLALLLRGIICYLLLQGVFLEFGKRKRPKCTTMPWDIWPSLVVLLGVCWMFYTPISPGDQLLFQQGFEEEEFPLFIPDFSSYLVPALNQPLLEDFPSWNQIGGFDAPNSPNLDLFGQTSFLFQASQPNYGYSTNFEVLSAQPIHVGSDLSEPTWHQNVAAPITSTLTTRHVNETPYTVTPQILNPDPQIQASRESLNPFEELRSPPRNAEGKFICTVSGCENGKTFSRRSDWQTHTDQHTRPFHCPVDGCTSRSATKGVLKRHLERVHKKPSLDASSISRGSETISISSHVDGTVAALSSTAVQSAPALDKGKGIAKRSLNHDNDAEERGKDFAEILDMEKNPKKVKRTESCTTQGDASSDCDKDLVAENKRLKWELELSRKELEWCQKEWKSEREMLLGIIGLGTQRVK